MRFTALPIPGAFRVDPEPRQDERGFFARIWCREEFAQHGIADLPSQINVGWNPRAGTLRGLHYQVAPDLESKLVRCTRGAVFDVLVDLRPGGGFGRWHAEELTAASHRALYIPPLCAHGYLTLEDDTEVLYHASAPYAPASARGVRWDDPRLGIHWPQAPVLMSEADRHWPLLAEQGS